MTQQDSIVEPARLLASGAADATTRAGQAGDFTIGNARSKYSVDFSLTAPTRFRFEAHVSANSTFGSGAAAWVEIRRNLFELVRGVHSAGPELSIDEFIVLPPGNYVFVGETQINMAVNSPGIQSGEGQYFGLLAVSDATLIGDLNCDGAVSVGDIGAFVLAITNPAQYAQEFPNCEPDNGDVNADGGVTVGDIGPFVALISNG